MKVQGGFIILFLFFFSSTQFKSNFGLLNKKVKLGTFYIKSSRFTIRLASKRPTLQHKNTLLFVFTCCEEVYFIIGCNNIEMKVWLQIIIIISD